MRSARAPRARGVRVRRTCACGAPYLRARARRPRGAHLGAGRVTPTRATPPTHAGAQDDQVVAAVQRGSHHARLLPLRCRGQRAAPDHPHGDGAQPRRRYNGARYPRTRRQHPVKLGRVRTPSLCCPAPPPLPSARRRGCRRRECRRRAARRTTGRRLGDRWRRAVSWGAVVSADADGRAREWSSSRAKAATRSRGENDAACSALTHPRQPRGSLPASNLPSPASCCSRDTRGGGGRSCLRRRRRRPQPPASTRARFAAGLTTLLRR